MASQKKALKSLGPCEVVKLHDDGDLTVKDASGCLHVVTTEGEVFTEQSCACAESLARPQCGSLIMRPRCKLVETILFEGGKPYPSHRWINEEDPVPEGYRVIENPEKAELEPTKTRWFGKPEQGEPRAQAVKALARLPLWQGKAYRAETGYKHEENQTAADVVRYEQEDLGNKLGVTDKALAELEAYPAAQLVWVARTKKVAAHYDGGAEYHLPPGSRIVAEDGDGGYLILKGEPAK